MMNRRTFLRFAATVPAFAIADRAFAQTSGDTHSSLVALEKTSGARLGVWALDTGNRRIIRHRADERFPLCSTFKVMLVAAILKRHTKDASLLEKRIRYTRQNLVTYSPITEKHLDNGLTVSELCAAALQYSDNTAGNLLMRLLNGPSAVTAFARSIGNDPFQLDRWETRLNSALPGDRRDTATPASMGRSLRKLSLGDVLALPASQQLNAWMRGNTTGDKRIRAAVPATWQVGDKTGSGDYGTANDIAVLWPPDRSPIILAIYSTHSQADSKWNDATIAQVAHLALSALSAR